MTRREGSTTKRLRGESNSASRFDTPELLRAMSRCIHAGNPKRTAMQLGLDYSTVCAWGQRHPATHPGESRPRLNGPAKQLAILIDGALEYADESHGREEYEAHVEDALAPLHWLAGQFGQHVTADAKPTTKTEAHACGLLLKSVGGLVEQVFEFVPDGFDEAERAELDSLVRATEARLHELRVLISTPRRLRAVGGTR